MAPPVRAGSKNSREGATISCFHLYVLLILLFFKKIPIKRKIIKFIIKIRIIIQNFFWGGYYFVLFKLFHKNFSWRGYYLPTLSLTSFVEFNTYEPLDKCPEYTLKNVNLPTNGSVATLNANAENGSSSDG